MKHRVDTLENLSEMIDYGFTASATAQPVGPKFLRITDIQNGAVDWNTVPFCKCANGDTKQYALKSGDIVFARTGATTGKSFLVRECPDGAVFASYLIRVRPGKELHPGFLAYFFNTPRYWQQITKHSTGSTQPGVNSTKLKELIVPVPPLAEQKRIAAILDQADAVRRKRQHALQLADDFPSSLFYEMFGDPVHDPKGWPVVPLEDICTHITDGVHAKPTYTETGVPFISVKDVTTGRLSFDDCKFIAEEDHRQFTRRCRPEQMDILYTKVGATYGRPALVDTKREFSIYVSVALIKPNSKLVDPTFLHEAMASKEVKWQADRSVKGAGVPDLHLIEIRSFKLPLPPMSVQREFVKKTEKIHEIQRQMQDSLKETDDLFNSLVQRAFRGEL